MISEDDFSRSYADLLDDTYDVVDRIVLNGYFTLAQSSGGFRMWWRRLNDGDDELDNTHLMRLSGRFSRRLRGWARKNDIPVVLCNERKHLIAEQYLPKDPEFRGIFLVLVGRAPAPVWDIQRFENGGINIRRKRPMPWVNHYHFHIMDDEWGHVTIKVCGQAPFTAQIMLNGHEYVSCLAGKANIGFTKEGNCFTKVSNARGLCEVAETLQSSAAVGRLEQVCERWIYQCVCFGLSFDEQKRSGFHYSYSVYQVEYSRNLLFTRGGQMEQLFSGIIDRIRGHLDVKTIKTIFGFKKRPKHKDKGKQHRCEVVVERPTYNLTVFKVHFGRLTLKMYTKGERVLRIEAIAHNTKELRCGRVVERFPRIISRLASMLERFLNVVRCVDGPWISHGTFESLPSASIVGESRVGGIDINSPRIRAAMAAVMALASAPKGFTAQEHAQKVREMHPELGDTYTVRQAAYDLKKLRGKDLVRKTGQWSHYYETTSEGLRTMAALVVLRDKVIVPLLAGLGRRKRGPKPPNQGPLDARLENIQSQMQELFKAMRFVA